MDALSDVLKSVRLEGAVYLNAEFTAPWCIRGECGLPTVRARLAGAEHVAFFHFLTEGSCNVRLVDGSETLDVSAGDLILFPQEGKHLMGSDLHLAPMEADAAAAADSGFQGGVFHMRYGGGGAVTRFVCGYLACSRSVFRPLFEALPRVLPVEDEEVSAQIARLFTRRGVSVRTGVKVVKVAPAKDGVSVEIDAEGTRETLSAAQVLMAVGRAARTKDLGLEALGVATERGLVTVQPTMETSVKGIFAVGDMAGRQMLAHKAMAEGVVAAEAIAGRSPRPVDYGNVPSCTYCRPQVASIGLSEAAAKADGREVSVGRFPFTANGKAVALGETEGFLKVVADKRTGEILGVHIVGPEATELIHEFAVGRTLEATLEEIIHTIHAHPTLSEASLEATLAALGQAIHI